jgi:hypothetical protein
VSAQQRPPIADQIAKAHGLDSWGQVDAIRYTFHIDWPKVKLKISRSWVWEPKTDQITYDGPDKTGNPVKITYSHSQPATMTEVVKSEIDPAFTNDSYVLLFPFHMIWDGTPTFEDAGKQKLPLGKGTAEKVVVKYPSDVGYTPGDTWGLYVDPDGRIRALEFQHGGKAPPKVFLATYSDYKKAGPLLFELGRRGKADGSPARIWFTNVAVKLVGSDTWTEAQ